MSCSGLIGQARRDPACASAALLGSAARGDQDEWSDIDFAVRLVPDADLDSEAERWAFFTADQVEVVDTLDVRAWGARSFVGYAARQADLVIRDQLTWVRRGSASRGLKQVLPDGRVLSTTTCPAHEPIVCAQKRPDSTFAVKLDRWGTGFINVSAFSRWSGSPRRWPTTVFDYPKAGREERHLQSGLSHPTVKPLALARELVRLYVPNEGSLLEPFAGSGTTVEAAIMENRYYVAFEREAAYLPLISARITRAHTRIGSVGHHEACSA